MDKGGKMKDKYELEAEQFSRKMKQEMKTAKCVKCGNPATCITKGGWHCKSCGNEVVEEAIKMFSTITVCPSWNDGCDSEACNGTKEEFIKGKCHSELHKAMKDGMLSRVEFNEWIKEVKR